MACWVRKRQHLAPKPNSSFFDGFSGGPYEMLKMSFLLYLKYMTCSPVYLEFHVKVSGDVLLLVWRRATPRLIKELSPVWVQLSGSVTSTERGLGNTWPDKPWLKWYSLEKKKYKKNYNKHWIWIISFQLKSVASKVASQSASGEAAAFADAIFTKGSKKARALFATRCTTSRHGRARCWYGGAWREASEEMQMYKLHTILNTQWHFSEGPC